MCPTEIHSLGVQRWADSAHSGASSPRPAEIQGGGTGRAPGVFYDEPLASILPTSQAGHSCGILERV